MAPPDLDRTHSARTLVSVSRWVGAGSQAATFAVLLIPTTLQIIVVWRSAAERSVSCCSIRWEHLASTLVTDDVNTDSAWTQSSCVTNGGSGDDDGKRACLTSISARHLSSSPALRRALARGAANACGTCAVVGWCRSDSIGTAGRRSTPEAVRHRRAPQAGADPVSRKTAKTLFSWSWIGNANLLKADWIAPTGPDRTGDAGTAKEGQPSKEGIVGPLHVGPTDECRTLRKGSLAYICDNLNGK